MMKDDDLWLLRGFGLWQTDGKEEIIRLSINFGFFMSNFPPL